MYKRQLPEEVQNAFYHSIKGFEHLEIMRPAYAPRDAESAAPVAPKRTERVDDFADFSFGKIEPVSYTHLARCCRR